MDATNRPIFCCEKMEKCSFQGFVLHRGLAWGRIEGALEAWRKAHSKYCGGRLIQLVGGGTDYKKFYEDIQTHIEMLVTPEMRAHACADENAHDLAFQIFRLLNGYDQALQELDAHCEEP